MEKSIQGSVCLTVFSQKKESLAEKTVFFFKNNGIFGKNASFFLKKKHVFGQIVRYRGVSLV